MTTSTSNPNQSDRCSVRVTSAPPRPSVLPGLWPISAPESLASSSVFHASPERRPGQPEHRVGRSQVERIGRQLSDRDQAILASLAMHHYLTSQQLQRFHFFNHDSHQVAARICRRSLNRLHELRIIEHLERRVGGHRAGSASYVWRVGLIGDRLLRLHTAKRSRARPKEPSLHHLDHCLAVADIHLTLKDLASRSELELLRVAGEPDAWRSYLGVGSSPQILKPDLYAVTASGDFEDHWFFELDRATESLPTLLRKCQQYQAYQRSGSEQTEQGIFPRVVWVMLNEGHADKLRRAIASTTKLPGELFRICTLQDLGSIIQGGAA